MVSLARFLVAAASTLFGLPMAFATLPQNASLPRQAFDPFTSEPPSKVCNEIAVTSPPITTSTFTQNQRGNGTRSLFLGMGSPGRNPSVSVVYGPYTNSDKMFFAKISSSIGFHNLSITYTERDDLNNFEQQIKYFTIDATEFCAVTGSEKWMWIDAVTTFK